MVFADFVHRRSQINDNQAEGRLFARSADDAVFEIHGPNIVNRDYMTGLTKVGALKKKFFY